MSSERERRAFLTLLCANAPASKVTKKQVKRTDTASDADMDKGTHADHDDE